MSLAFYFYSPTKYLIGHIGGEHSRGGWRCNKVRAKQEKHCKGRFDDGETGTSQISGTADGVALQSYGKNTEWVFGIARFCCVDRDNPLNSSWPLFKIENIGLDNL